MCLLSRTQKKVDWSPSDQGWSIKSRGHQEFRGEAIVIEDWPVQFIPVSDASTLRA
jgi:hypothetical protein